MGMPGIDFPGLGVGLLIRDESGRILLYKRVKAPEAGHWSIPGGKVDHMERSADAARREAEEETGLSFGPISFLCLSEQLIEADGQHWISVIYTTRSFSGDARITEPDKLSDMGWFAPDALPSPLSAFARDAVAQATEPA